MLKELSGEEFVAKVDWEGGVVDALEYGMRSTDLGPDEYRLADAWLRVEHAWREHMLPAINGYRKVVHDLGLDN